MSFLDYESPDPSAMAREAGADFSKARQAVEDQGVKSFLFQASSPEEFDQRVEFGGVSEVLDEVADKYLGPPDQRAKLTSALRREFLAQSPYSTSGLDNLINPSWCGDCKGTGLERCPDCFGSGFGIRKDDRDKCSTCSGIGHLKRNCPVCSGLGSKTSATETVHLKAKGDEPARDVNVLHSSRACPACGDQLDEAALATEASQREAALTGLCARCQDDYFGNEEPIEKVAAKFAVCPSCEGEGKYVNPSIDSQGISPEDFDEDPDFEESYMGGAYDVPCSECRGKGLVPGCSEPDCKEPARAHFQDNGFGMGESRGRYEAEHYPTCYEHMNDDEKRNIQEEVDNAAEYARERQMFAATQVPSWIRESSIHFDVDASVACEDCGSDSGVSPWLGGHKICTSCRTTYETSG